MTSAPAATPAGSSPRDTGARALARRLFDGLERAAAASSARSPTLALAVAATVGWCRNALSRRWPSPAAVAGLLGVPPATAESLSRRIGALEARNRLCAALVARHGYGVLRPLVRWVGDRPEALATPCLLVTFHVGAQHALGAALPDLPGDHLRLRWSALDPTAPTGALAMVGGELEQRSAALLGALRHLAAGGVVVSAADGAAGAQAPAHCLGRPLPLARGPLFLAARSGAPLVPLLARWRGNAIVAELGPAIAAPRAAEPAAEALAAAALAEWLDGTLRRYPDQLTLGLLRRLRGEA